MADNVIANSGSGGATFATDDIGGVHYPITKITIGALDSQTLLSGGNGVTDAGTIRVTVSSDSTGVLSIDDNGASLTVDNAGTFAIQEDGAALTALQLIDDVVYTDDTSTHSTGVSKGAGIMAAATPTDASVGVNDIGMLAMSTDRRLHVDAQIVGQDADVTIADGGNVISTDWNGTAPPIGAGTEAAALRVTVATDSTGVLSVDDNGGALTVDNGGTFVVQEDGAALTALQLIDDIVYTDDTSTHATGTSKGAGIMAAATPTDGSVAANDIGMLAMSTDRRLHVELGTVGGNNQVVVSAVTPGTAVLNLGKAEDAPHGSGDVGVMALAVRQDTQVDFGADGDYVPLSIDANGALRVSGGGGGTQYTEDAVAPADPVGNAVALVREDAAVSIAADGDIVAQRATQYGAAYCQILDSSGNFVDSFGGSGGTSHNDDAAFTIGSANSITPTGYLADETTPDSVDEGDVGVPRMSLNRVPYAILRDAAGNERGANINASNQLAVEIFDGGDSHTIDNATLAVTGGGVEAGALRVTIANDSTGVVSVDDNGGALTVDGTVTADAGTGTFTVDTPDGSIAIDELPAAAALADNTANPTTTLIGSCLLGFDGTNWERVTTTASGDLVIADGGNVISIDWNGTAPPIGAGTEAAALRVTLATDSTGVVSIDDNGGSLTVDAAGDVAHDAVDSGNPFKLGAKAIAHGANPTAVAADDRSQLYCNRHGVPWFIGGHPNVVSRTALVTDADGAQTNTALVTVGAGTKVVVTRVSIVVSDAVSVTPDVRVGFGTASVPTATTTGVNGLLVDFRSVPSGGGITIGDGSGILGIGADNEDVRYTCNDPVDGDLCISVSYYTIES